MQGIPMIRMISFVVIVVAVVTYVNWPEKPHFTKETIKQTQDSIRKKFEERPGVKVIEVKMVQASERKLIGFAKLESEDLKNLGQIFKSDGTISKSCSATMGDDWRWIWSCE